MNVWLAIAGWLCCVLALGHTVVARRLLLDLPDSLPLTRFGDGEFTRGAIEYTFYALGLMLAAPGVALIALAQNHRADDRGVVVALIGAGYAAALLLLVWRHRRRPSELFPMPPFWLLTAISILVVVG